MFDKIVQRGTLTTVVVLIICILGVVAALRIPVQMIPDLEVRTVTIRTAWPGATPQDIEKEIIIEQEEYLRSVPNLQRIISSASFGQASIEMEFPFGIDLNETLIHISNALLQVPSYPINVDEPRIYATSFSSNSFMFFRISPLENNQKNLNIINMQDYIDDHVRTRMETVAGVSLVNVYGGAERQIQIILDTVRLSEKNITIDQVKNAIVARNRDVSGGEVESGKRRYLIRTVGRFSDLDELRNMIINKRGDAITRLHDIAQVRLHHFDIDRLAYTDGKPVIGLSVRRQAGSNVIKIKDELLKLLPQINQEMLHPKGMHMQLIADDVGYVASSIKNVWTNLLLGALLASLVMYIFLRSFKTTMAGVIGIPICTIAAFIGLLITERTINVISLAGIAFAIGMTLDNGIVVLESIEQQRKRGQKKFQASIEGVQQVWPAVLASTLTTILVFVPIIFISEEAGQLYSDIAIAISASILASMLVAIMVIPTLMAQFNTKKEVNARTDNKASLSQRSISIINAVTNTKTRRWAVITLMPLIAIVILSTLTPPAEYLPEGEEPKTFASLSSPPGYNLTTMSKIGDEIQNYFLPYLNHSADEYDTGKTKVPAIAYLNMSIDPQRIRIISQPKDAKHIKALMQSIEDKYEQYPGMRAFVTRGSIITSNSGGTRSINLDISGPDLNAIYDAALAAYERAQEVFTSPRIRAEPSTLSLSQPLVRVLPKWERAIEVGMDVQSLGFTVSTLTDGAFVDEFFLQDDKIDIFMHGEHDDISKLDSLYKIPIYTPVDTILPLSAIATIEETVDTNIIRRLNSQRTITLNVIPPDNIALETGVEIVKKEIIEYLRNHGQISSNIQINITGASDQLEATKTALTSNYIIAIAIIYLLLVAIFSHWGLPLLIMTSIPLGIAGGIFGFWLFNNISEIISLTGHNSFIMSFDMITMIGFLILMGTVVNNPILIVHQSMMNKKTGKAAVDAVQSAVSSRLRPIAMSTLTTIFGLAPLVFLGGEGTELYRGVGVIVMFGLLGTAIVSLTFLPALTVAALKRFY